MIRSLTFLLAGALLLSPTAARAIDAVPEPGLLIYGQVFSQNAPTATVAVASMAWNGSPGGTGAAVTSGLYPSPPAPVSGNPSYYVARVPYESPNAAGLSLAGTGWFDLVSAGTDAHQVGFTVTPASGGQARIARIKAVNGVQNGGAADTWPTFFNWNDITAAKRGGVVRLDLVVDAPPSAMDYWTWIRQYFPEEGDPKAEPTANPDGDPFDNASEYDDDTSPIDVHQFFRIAAIAAASATTVSITWISKAGESYVLERSSTLAPNSWTVVGTFVGTAGQTVAGNIQVPQGPSGSYWRVRTTR